MKVKFDKKLNKYHIRFDKKNVKSEKKEIYAKLTSKYELVFTFDTEIDGKKEEEREADVAALIDILNTHDLTYEISTKEVHTSKKILGIPTMTKVKNIHSTIKASIAKNVLSDDLIAFFLEHEIKINFLSEPEKEEEFYDSAIFQKMFSTYDLSKL